MQNVTAKYAIIDTTTGGIANTIGGEAFDYWTEKSYWIFRNAGDDPITLNGDFFTNAKNKYGLDLKNLS